ncbi:hypothetical protein VP150E351_P0154 [Vibrio phage 150E35-1]|nr:hypothetical protein VP150E351_P0154 [Vibrio phage 150E35-1]
MDSGKVLYTLREECFPIKALSRIHLARVRRLEKPKRARLFLHFILEWSETCWPLKYYILYTLS